MSDEITLYRVWTDYKQLGRLKPHTESNYKHRILTHLGDWLHLPITSITKDMVQDRHRELGQRGHVLANSTMKTLRALLHFAAHKYVDDQGRPIIAVNPVIRLSELRAWYREKRRDRVITNSQFKPWFDAVLSLNNDSVRDILILLLLTGMRSGECIPLLWSACDLEAGIITLQSTKNGDRHHVPLTDYAWNLLLRRRATATSEFVFPGRHGTHGRTPMTSFHSAKLYGQVVHKSGVEFSPHDLRRSFCTVADELEIKSEVVKALVNHRSGDDVTEGYTIRSIERLRRASQLITDTILKYAGVSKSPVLQLNNEEIIHREIPRSPAPPNYVSGAIALRTKPQPRVSQGVKLGEITIEAAILYSVLVHDGRPCTARDIYNWLCTQRRVRWETMIEKLSQLVEEGYIIILELKPLTCAKIAPGYRLRVG